MSSESDDRDRFVEEEAAHVTRPTARYRERNFHDSHGVSLAPENEAWLATRDQTVDTVVAVERIRDENPRAYATLMRATADDVCIRVVRAILARHGTVTYDDLEQYVGGVTARTIKTKVSTLRDGNVVDVGNGRPAAISFVDRDVALLAEDTVARLE